MTAINFSSIKPTSALFMQCHAGYNVLFAVAAVASILNLFIIVRILIRKSLRKTSFFTYIVYGSCSTCLYLAYYLAQAAMVCVEEAAEFFLMAQSSCFLVIIPVYITILTYEASILLLSADRASAYMKPLLYRSIGVKYAAKLCCLTFTLIALELAMIYAYQFINDGPVYCVSTGAGMNPTSQRIFMSTMLAIRVSSFILNIVLYSHRWIVPGNKVQGNSTLDTEQKEWLAKFKEDQKPFFRILLYLTISSLVLGTPFGVMEYVVAYMGDASQQKMFRSLAIGFQYCAYITDALSLLFLNKLIRVDLLKALRSSIVFNLSPTAPAGGTTH